MPNPFARTYTGFVTGEVSGSVAAKQLPSIEVRGYVKLQALSSNAANVYFGIAGVTVPDGTTDTTSGFALAPGAESDPLFVTNLDDIYIIGTAATDDISYIIHN